MKLRLYFINVRFSYGEWWDVSLLNRFNENKTNITRKNLINNEF